MNKNDGAQVLVSGFMIGPENGSHVISPKKPSLFALKYLKATSRLTSKVDVADFPVHGPLNL